MKTNIITMLHLEKFKENGIFFIMVLASSLTCYSLYGPIGSVFGVVTAIFSNMIYNAKKDTTNIFFLFFLLSTIIIGCWAGATLKLSVYFYIYLFIISFVYYFIFGKNDYIDRVIPFLIIFSCMGTTLHKVPLSMALSYLTGIAVCLIILTVLKHKNFESNAFKNAFLADNLFQSTNIKFLAPLIYSIFLFLSLKIPDYFNLYRAFWSPLTFVVLIKPHGMDIIKIALHRFIGSILGAIFIILLINIIKQHHEAYIIILILFIFLLPSFLKGHYIVKTFGITTLILLLLEETLFLSDPSYKLPYSRVYETLIGGSIAVLASAVLKIARRFEK